MKTVDVNLVLSSFLLEGKDQVKEVASI